MPEKDNSIEQSAPQQHSSESDTVSAPKTRLVKRTQITQEIHIGPLPSPDVLREYDNICPGSAERILHMAERQQEHRLSLESTVIVGDSKRANRGLIYGLVIALAFLAVGGFLIYSGHDWAGVTLGSLDIIGLASVFVYGSISRRSERLRKSELMNPQEDIDS